MTVIEQDSRTGAADREYHSWLQRGADPEAVKAMLPALVGPPAVAEKAAAWLSRNALIGHDLSDEGVAHARAVANGAKAFMQQAMERGEFAGHGAMFKPGNRYMPDEKAMNAQLDRQQPLHRYPGSADNARTLALSKMEAEAQIRHRRHDLTLHDDGRLTTPDGEVVERLTVPESRSRLTLTDTAPKRPGADLSNTVHYSKAEADEDYWQQGANTPYWAQD